LNSVGRLPTAASRGKLDSDYRLSAETLLVTSAPEEKNRPSPVMIVKVVSGWSFNILNASTVSVTMSPPKEFSAFGRLNWVLIRYLHYQTKDTRTDLDHPNAVRHLHDDIVVI
jgi:hypothetical protein